MDISLATARHDHHEHPAAACAISVRRATASDVPAIADLVNRAYAVESFFVDGDRTDIAEIAEMTKQGFFLVLDSAHAPCGLAAAVYLEPRAGSLYIGMLSVCPTIQGRGLGKRLVRIAEALAEAMGYSVAELRIVNLREELSRWYRSLGYRETGTAPYVKHRPVKQACHFVDMQHDLSSSALAAVA